MDPQRDNEENDDEFDDNDGEEEENVLLNKLLINLLILLLIIWKQNENIDETESKNEMKFYFWDKGGRRVEGDWESILIKMG